jgi:hypothetical protein
MAFNDLSAFGTEPSASKKVDEIHAMLAKRGLLHLRNMPKGRAFDEDRIFLRDISKEYRDMFKEITITFYINEYAFSWKQHSAVQQLMRI